MTHLAGGSFELFISYARKDNAPQKPTDSIGWVECLRSEILTRHRSLSTAPLRIFFDKEDIHGMDDWRHRILLGLQQSKILLVCLSPEYFRSDNCLWEWEEFHRHKASRLIGHESIAPVYFVEAPDSDDQAGAAFKAFVQRGQYSEEDTATFIPRWKEWHAAVRRFNHFDFRPWFPDGSAALAEDEVKRRLDELAGSLTDRIARTRRAAGVPSNLRECNPHFVGRSKQLVQLHETLIKDGAVGVITAVNGLGGQGKTEFAITYAHGHADSYPGGLWVLGAEGRTELLPLFASLAGDPRLGIPLSADPNETDEQCGRRVLARLKDLALAAREADIDRGASCLVILDNVSEASLLAKTQRNQLPNEDWLRLVVTTRLGPDAFPVSHGGLHFMEMDSLDEDDGVDLIRNHQPPRDPDGLHSDFAHPAEDGPAAREIVRELGGYTLAVESVAIYLGLHPEIGPASYLARLRAEGLPRVDELSADTSVADQMHHREKQLRLVLDQTLSTLETTERTALGYAAFLPPDSIPWPWLRALAEAEHPKELAPRSGYPEPWTTARRRLEGFRLLTPGDHLEIARMHRMIAVHIRERMHEQSHRVLERVCEILDHVCAELEVAWADDPTSRWQLAPLQEVVQHWSGHSSDAGIGRIACVVGDIEAHIGRLDLAAKLLEFANQSLEVALGRDSTSGNAARDVSVSSNKLASVLARRSLPGDAARALELCERSLDIRKGLLETNPGSSETARDVSLSLGLMAELLRVRGWPGDAEKVIVLLEQELAINERMLSRDPDSERAARDIAMSLGKVAEVLERRGFPEDLQRAVELCERSVDISEDLLRAIPESAQAARDVAACLGGLAGSLAARSLATDAERVCDYYERGLQVCERLLKADPESAQAARDVSIALDKLADYLLRRRRPVDLERSLKLCVQSLAILDGLLKANPDSGQAARDVSVTLNILAGGLTIRAQSGDAERALRHYERSLELSERLLEANPTSAWAASDAVISLERTAEVKSFDPDPSVSRGALEMQLRALMISRNLLESNPRSTHYRRSVAISLFLTYKHAMGAGKQELAINCLNECNAVLQELVAAGVILDARMARLHEVLAAAFRLHSGES